MNGEKGYNKVKKILKFFISVFLIVLLFSIVCVLVLCSGDGRQPGAYSDNATDVIRVFSLLEAVISVLLLMVSRKKITVAALVVCNLFTLCKFISTF